MFVACMIWRVVYFTLNTSPPANVTNMFSNWPNGVDKKQKCRFELGLAFWFGHYRTTQMTLFLTNTEMIFFLQVIRMDIHWIHE
jgi:hypothetical protein